MTPASTVDEAEEEEGEGVVVLSLDEIKVL